MVKEWQIDVGQENGDEKEGRMVGRRNASSMARNLVLDCFLSRSDSEGGRCVLYCRRWLFLSITADGELWEVLEVATAMFVLLQV